MTEHISTKMSKHGPVVFWSNWDIGLWSFWFSSAYQSATNAFQSGPTEGIKHCFCIICNRSLLWVTITLVFANQVPIEKSWNCNGTCFDVLYLTTGCYENLFFKEIPNVKVGFHCFKNQWEPALMFIDLHQVQWEPASATKPVLCGFLVSSEY